MSGSFLFLHYVVLKYLKCLFIDAVEMFYYWDTFQKNALGQNQAHLKADVFNTFGVWIKPFQFHSLDKHAPNYNITLINRL